MIHAQVVAPAHVLVAAMCACMVYMCMMYMYMFLIHMHLRYDQYISFMHTLFWDQGLGFRGTHMYDTCTH